MKYSLFICLLFQLYTLSAQNKSDRVRLKSENGINIFYKYDEQGRLSQMRNSRYRFYESYVYSNDSVFIYAVDLLDSTLEKVYKLNKSGLIEHIGLLSNDVFYYEYYKYENTFLSKKQHRYPINGQGIVYEWKDGNKIKENFNDTSFQVNGFSYQQSVIMNGYSPQINTLTNENFGQSFLGNSNKNLLTKSINTSYISDVCTQSPCPILQNSKRVDEYTYEYTFDEIGRVKEEIKTNIVTLKIIKIKYYYY